MKRLLEKAYSVWPEVVKDSPEQHAVLAEALSESRCNNDFTLEGEVKALVLTVLELKQRKLEKELLELSDLIGDKSI